MTTRKPPSWFNPPGGTQPGFQSTTSGLLIPAHEVKKFHENDDKDIGPDAHHHTLGIGPNQAAAGDHKHDSLYVAKKNLTPYVPEVRGNGNNVLVSTGSDSVYKEVDGLVFINFELFLSNLNGATGVAVVSLPFASAERSVIHGRENTATGWSIHGIANPGQAYMFVFSYANGSVLFAGYTYVLTGWYAKG